MAEIEQRKLAAIMFTDIVGYSALTQRNEAHALELLEEHRCLLRPLFLQHGGQEIKTIGDRFLVEFASALDATRCAIEIQRTLTERNASVPTEKKLQVRIGIHVGDVVHRENDVYGDGINIADRIEPLAEPGGICVSEDVARQIQNKIEAPVVRLGRGELKNIQTPVSLYKIALPWEKHRLPVSERFHFKIRQTRNRFLAVPLVIAGLLAGAYLWRGIDVERSGAPSGVSRNRRRIAVLPFVNISADAKDDGFAYGMTDTLITDLSQIQALRVISLNSVMAYQKTRKPPAEIGRALDVDTVVEGSVQRSADDLRVNVKLIDAANGDQLWGRRFDGQTQSLFAVQDQISGSVVSELRLTVTPQEEEKLKAIPTQDLQAYDDYVNGKFYLSHENRKDTDTAIRLLERAVQRDTTFARAHAELARAYDYKSALFGQKQWHVKASNAVKKALELDPDLPEAHVAQGRFLWTRSNHFPHELAVKEYRRALAVNPNLDEAHHQLAIVYYHIGLLDEARRELQQAVELNPANTAARFRIGTTYYYEGKYEQALAVYESIPRDISPALREYHMASTLFYLGRKGEALVRARKFLKEHAADEGGLLTSLQAILLAAAGDRRRAEDSIQRATEMGKDYVHFHHTAHNIAAAYALMNRPDPAIQWLEKAARDGLPNYPAFEKDSNLAPLRTHPRFIAFMTSLKKQWEKYQRL